MDFNIIEGLTDKEVLDLYDDINMDDNSERLGGCFCVNGNTCTHLGQKGNNTFDGCHMQILNRTQCKQWCTSKGLPWSADVEGQEICVYYNGAQRAVLPAYFGSQCWCNSTSQYSTWTNCPEG